MPHPLIAPPRLVAPAAQAVRWTALRQLRAHWRQGRLDVLLPSGDAVQLGGGGPAEASVVVGDDRAFLRLLLRGELGAGEAFVAGEWSSSDLVAALRVVLRATAARGVESWLTRAGQLAPRWRHRRAANTVAGSARNVHAHYDLGNAFYRLFLDEPTLSYSCAIWAGAPPAGSAPTVEDLAAAQQRKHERLCDLLELGPRDRLLEIGCGWGGMALHAAKTRGCQITAITISRRQLELARERVAAAGLADRVRIELRDYRDPALTAQRFDKIVAIEMLEQVGYDYLPDFFATSARLLSPAGRLAVQTITMPDERFDAYRRGVDWMQTYVFPGTLIPSLEAIRAASGPFTLARMDDIGPHYAPTLRIWRERFVSALPAVRALGFDAPFVRTWLLYLAFSEAAFAERTLGDHQLLFVR
jgi:cyclopropane-fatty-acyl-phospholipid synthase